MKAHLLVPSNRSQGFTLIEMLISIVLVSMMIALASVALRQLVLSWDRIRDPYPSAILPMARVRATVHSLVPYAIRFSDGFGARLDSLGFFFTGTEQSIVFISNSPPSLNQLALIRLYRQQDRLILSETPLYAGSTDYLAPLESDLTRTTIVLTGVDKIQFLYEDEEGVERELDHRLPSLIRLNIVYQDDRERSYIFTVRARFPDKFSMQQTIDVN